MKKISYEELELAVQGARIFVSNERGKHRVIVDGQTEVPECVIMQMKTGLIKEKNVSCDFCDFCDNVLLRLNVTTTVVK